MSIDRRHFLAATTATGAFTATEAIAAPASSSSVPVSGLGVDAFHLGVRTSSTDDQTEALQRAIDRTAGARLPLILPPGVYRARALVLQTGARLVGVPGATRIVATDNLPLIVARRPRRPHAKRRPSPAALVHAGEAILLALLNARRRLP